MNKIQAVLVLVSLIVVSQSVAADKIDGTYVKSERGHEVGWINIKKLSEQSVRVEIKTTDHGATCGVGNFSVSTARAKGNKAIYRSSEDKYDVEMDNSLTCVIGMEFAGNKLRLVEKGCESKCGNRAAGSIGGLYSKASGSYKFTYNE